MNTNHHNAETLRYVIGVDEAATDDKTVGKDAPAPATEDKTVGFGVFENAVTGKLFVGCWTESDSRENAIEGSNFYPTEAAASVGVIEALNAVVAKLQDENASLRAAIEDAVEAWIGEGHEFDQAAVADALMPWVSDHLKAGLAPLCSQP